MPQRYSDDSDECGSDEEEVPPTSGPSNNTIFPFSSPDDEAVAEERILVQATISDAAAVAKMLKEKEAMCKAREDLDRRVAEMDTQVADKSRDVGLNLPLAQEAISVEIGKFSEQERAVFTEERFAQDALKERRIKDTLVELSAAKKRAHAELLEHQAATAKHKRYRALCTYQRNLEDFAQMHARLLEAGHELRDACAAAAAAVETDPSTKAARARGGAGKGGRASRVG